MIYEQSPLGRKVLFHITVVIEVIARQIREHTEIEAPLFRIAGQERFARDLDRLVPGEGGAAEETLAGVARSDRGKVFVRVKGNHVFIVDGVDVWIAGDCARFPKRVPQLAQTAKQQGELAAQNLLDPDRAKTYEPDVKGSIISLGPDYAVAELPTGQGLKGKLPWHIKKQYYKWTIRRH